MKKFMLVGVAAATLTLAACGDGYEMKNYDLTPYGGERTAGSGVTYVRASMMAERGPVIQAEMEEHKEIIEPAEAAPEPEPVSAATEADMDGDQTDRLLQSGERFFRDLQRK